MLNTAWTLARRFPTAWAALALVSSFSAPAFAQSSLVASAARTASGTASITAFDPSTLASAVFFLNITAAATDNGDKLDVYIQHSWDGGTTFDDFVHFTQADGDGGAVSYLAFWTGDVTPEDEERAEADATLAEASVLQGPNGGTWRVKWVVTDVSTDDASFTFSLVAEPRYRGK